MWRGGKSGVNMLAHRAASKAAAISGNGGVAALNIG
jgi:hypothetical protein